MRWVYARWVYAGRTRFYMVAVGMHADSRLIFLGRFVASEADRSGPKRREGFRGCFVAVVVIFVVVVVVVRCFRIVTRHVVS